MFYELVFTIWYCKKLYFPQIFFFSLFPPLIFFPTSKPFDSPPHGGGEKLNYIQACFSQSSINLTNILILIELG